MKIQRTAFPHPVLAEFNDDYKKSKFNAELIEVTPMNDGFCQFSVKFELENSRLEELVNNHEAVFATLIDCSSSMYREVFTTTNRELTFLINQKKLTKQVEVSFVVIANTTIVDYENELLHEDYDGQVLTFDKGKYLAVAPGVTLPIEKDPFVPAKSIFNLRESDEENPEPYDVYFGNEDVIDIKLPPKVYEQISNIQRYEHINPLLITMYYLPALIDALTYIWEVEEGNNTDPAQDNEWYKSILFQLDQLQIDPKKINEIGASVIAHIILKDVVKEALNSLSDYLVME
ncbi:hypothetical protein [Bacillus sinesaloumensis]|uniref:hypothetical protein n=1 Tax=Litchfieldia sinesaloumensis TaxID=1926280 RepID=UPI00098860E1|nr:hypothetical protein [Bacillus sinesaloumensis]